MQLQRPGVKRRLLQHTLCGLGSCNSFPYVPALLRYFATAVKAIDPLENELWTFGKLAKPFPIEKVCPR